MFVPINYEELRKEFFTFQSVQDDIEVVKETFKLSNTTLDAKNTELERQLREECQRRAVSIKKINTY